jgi:hypothetical protein
VVGFGFDGRGFGFAVGFGLNGGGFGSAVAGVKYGGKVEKKKKKTNCFIIF